MPRALPFRGVPSRRLLTSLSILTAGAIWLSACSTTDIAGGTAAPTLVIPPGPPVAVDVALLPGQVGPRLLSRREGSGADAGGSEERLRQPLRDRARAPRAAC